MELLYSAISGVLAGDQKKADLFGVSVLAIVTAVGGGTIRDLVLGVKPVFWVDSPIYIVIPVVTAVLFFFILKRWHFPLVSLRYFDALGLAVFTVIGAEKALSLGYSAVIAIFMATLTGVGGGMIRDIISNRIPVILRKDFYASSCLIGACFYLCVRSQFWGIWATVLVTLAIRVWAIRTIVQLPVFEKKRRKCVIINIHALCNGEVSL